MGKCVSESIPKKHMDQRLLHISWQLTQRFLIGVLKLVEGGSRNIAIGRVRGVPHPLIFSLLAHLPNVNSARQHCIADKLKKIPICRQIGLERSLFVGKLGLCALLKLFFSLVTRGKTLNVPGKSMC